MRKENLGQPSKANMDSSVVKVVLTLLGHLRAVEHPTSTTFLLLLLSDTARYLAR